jgi:demethylmenaquinone methyltransferase/2-methoxy-6-polyprenyl-1,4-benzoquinol methylase
LKGHFAEEFSASLLFFFASLLTGLVSLVAFGFVWAKHGGEKRSEPTVAEGFLADEHRALSFYKIFSVAYDILNPYLYTDGMRKEMVDQIGYGANLRVLDVGCGTGYTTLAILRRKDACDVVGLDMNPVQLKRARRNLSQEKGRLTISRGDADNLPFVDESFDAVVSVGAIEYFPEPQLVLNEFARVTRPGGTIVVGGPEAEWFSKFALNKIFYTPSSNELQKFFHRAGLLEVKSVLTGVNTFFGTSRYVAVAVGNKPSLQVS